VDSIFDAARGCGINLIDTAECYGDHLSERLVGGAVAGDRDRWVIATKFGHEFQRAFERTEPRRPADVRAQLEASLKALGTEYIDLYQYHSWGDEEFFDDDVLAVLHAARDAGKVRHIGNSVRKSDYRRQVEASGSRGLGAVQVIYNRLERGAEAECFDVCERDGLGVLARVPLASGYLSGKYKPGHEFDKGEVRGKWHSRERTDGALREVERIGREEVPEGVEMARWALAWCLRHPAVSCVIPGCKDAEQVRKNAAASGLVEDGHRLDAGAVLGG